jgi:isoquinoline 1-oxidoreductase alpha subunit
VPSYSFTLNGKKVSVDAPGDLSVLWALRDKLGVTGPKYGCGINVCKACTSHLDGKAFNPCVTNLRDVAGREVTTIEGLANGDRLHSVQEAWLEQDVAQCGYCQPGQIMAAVALLKRTSNPTDEEIDAIENVCRCGSYFRIREAIKAAAKAMSTQVTAPASAAAGRAGVSRHA